MNYLQDISKFNKISDYLPILNGAIAADIIVLFILYYTKYFNSKYLKIWYEKYRLSAVIADVLILVIGIILARMVYYSIFDKYNTIYFIGLILIIQIIHDILFYALFQSTPVGMNKMFDLFKSYAKEVSYGAILGDSFMIIIAIILAMFFASFSLNTNIILVIFLTYMIPYILYTK